MTYRSVRRTPMTVRRWYFLMFVCVLLAAGYLAWPRQKPGSLPVESLTLAVVENFIGIPILIAIEKGFYRAEGLDIDYKALTTGKASFEAVLRGEAEVAMVAETPFVRESFGRRDFVIVSSFGYSYADSRVVARKDRGIRSARDLRGHRVGVLASTSAQFFLHTLLADHGLTPADLTEVPLSSTEITDRLVQGQVDAVAAFEPYAYQALRALGDQGVSLAAPGRIRETFNFVTRRDLPQRRLEALARLLRGTDRAIAWMASHRPEAIAIVARRLRMEPQVIESLWDAYRPALRLDQTLLFSLEDCARWAMHRGLVRGSQMPNYLDFVDVSVLQAVKPEAITLIH